MTEEKVLSLFAGVKFDMPMNRMLLIKRAAGYLKLKFHLVINGHKLL